IRYFHSFPTRRSSDLPCYTLLPCGHSCIYKCHFDNPDHIGIDCPEPCPKFHSECAHKCLRLCFQDCGSCNFSIGNITLPDCGHRSEEHTSELQSLAYL